MRRGGGVQWPPHAGFRLLLLLALLTAAAAARHACLAAGARPAAHEHLLAASPPLHLCRWKQYRFHVEEDDNEVVVSVAMEGEAGGTGRASFDLFLKAEQPAGEERGWVVPQLLLCFLSGAEKGRV